MGYPSMQSKKPKSGAVRTFTIDCGTMGEDRIVTTEELVEFFKDQIKVDNKKRNLKDKIRVFSEESAVKVAVEGTKFSKKYLKYLTKKWISKAQVRDYVRIVSSGKDDFTLKYFEMKKSFRDIEI